MTATRLAAWIRRYRIAWLERKADEMEREFMDAPYSAIVAAEASRMRAKAKLLREGAVTS
jgi:hypothetical protein